MSKAAPQRKTPSRRRHKPGIEGFIEFMKELKPTPEFVADLERAYQKRHEGFEDADRGPSRRRHTTRKPSSK